MKGRNHFTKAEESAIRVILVKIAIKLNDPKYLRWQLRTKYGFYVSDFKHYSNEKSFSVADFDAAKICGEIVVT